MTVGQRAAQAIRERFPNGTKIQMEMLGLNAGCIYDWKNGRANPTSYALAQMALAGYDIYWILTGERK